MEARDASEECQGGLPVLALLEGNGHAVNAYLADCGNGTARKALVIPDGAAASGDGIACNLGGDFVITGDAVVADGIRADDGDTVQCRDGRPFKLRAGAGDPLPGGTTCEASDETLVGHFALAGQDEVEVTVAAMLVRCGATSALIVPIGATTTVDPIIDGVQLRCPDHRFQIRNQADSQSVGGQLVVVASDRIADCEAKLKGRNRETALFDLKLASPEPASCDVPGGSCTVFVTSSGRDGDFGLDDPAGPLAFADAECNRLAGDAGLPGGYKAWLSDDTASPSTRFTTASVPYVRVDGVRIADDWTDLTTCDASGTVCLDNRINLTEKSEAAPQWAWTGTTTDGNSSPDSCNEWTLTQSRGIVGDTSRINYFWTGALLGVGQVSGGRGSIRSFLCFQQ